jgi:hypothetical protein
MRKATPFLLMFMMLAPAPAQEHEITIAVPRDGAGVPWRACLAGITSLPQGKLVAIVHPMEVGEYAVQPAVTIRDGGRYKVEIYVGEPGRHAGKHFEIRLFSDPAGDLSEGTKLDGWPAAAAGESPVIEVVRDDKQQSGCEEAQAFVASAAGNPLPGVNQPPKGGQPGVAVLPPRERVRGLGSVLAPFAPGALVVLALLFVAMMTLLERVETGVQRLVEWMQGYLSWLVLTALYLAASVAGCWRWLLDRWLRCARPVWQAKGFAGNLQQFALRLILVAPLQLAMVFALYADASMIVRGLNPIFGIESRRSAGDAAGSGFVGSLLGLGGKPAPRDAALEVPPAAGFARQVFDQLKTGFATLWKEEELGFLAISLACLQAAMGVVLLWQMGLTQPLGLRLRTLWRERPLLTGCFLTLDLALGVLAACRGFQLSPEAMSGAAPAVVSGLLGIVTPLILAFTQHYAVECAADCLGVAKAVGLIAGLTALALAAISGWTVLLLVVLAVVGGGFALFFCFFVGASAFLLLARTMGELARKMPMPRFLEPHLSPQWRALAATAVSLTVVGAVYYAVRGLTQ